MKTPCRVDELVESGVGRVVQPRLWSASSSSALGGLDKWPHAPRLSHMIFGELPEKATEKFIIPAGLFELPLHRAFGPFQPGEVEGQSA